MPKNEVHLELLLSSRVVDQQGNTLGRIEEVHAEEQGSDLVVSEYLLGPHALMERLSAWVTGIKILQWLGAKPDKSIVIPWDKLDLNNPEKPIFTGTPNDLKRK